MFIWTDDAKSALWEQLNYFSSSANVYSVITGKVKTSRKNIFPDSDTTKEVAKLIASCNKQAIQFYSASFEIGFETKPILLYYGANCLAKAILYSNGADPGSHWEHGISFKGQRGASSVDDFVERSTIETKLSGLFPDFFRSIRSCEIPGSTKINLIDLLSVTPEIEQQFELHFGRPSRCVRLYTEMQTHEDQNVSLFFKETNEELNSLYDLFPELQTDYVIAFHNSTHTQFKSKKPPPKDAQTGFQFQHIIAGHYLVRPIVPNLVDPYSVTYLGMFGLSNLARYFPSFWSRMIEGNDSGLYPLLSQFCNVHARRMPNFALDHFWGEEVLFGAPGYLS